VGERREVYGVINPRATTKQRQRTSRVGIQSRRMRPSRGRLSGIAIAAAAFAALMVTGAAEAQNFRISYDVDRAARPGQVVVRGKVVNEGPSDCFDVSVTAEALNSGGKVVASGVTYVDSRIARGDSKPFVAVVPSVPAATRYRVEVSSFRSGFTFQAP